MGSLHFSMHDRYVSVHPVALAMAGAAGAFAKQNNLPVTADLHECGGALRYMVRMGLFNFIEVEHGVTLSEHEPAGRFIPLTQIRSSDELSKFIVEMVPLLHADPDEAGPMKYVISELVRNVLEHSLSSVGAIICAQYFQKTQRLSVGVSDLGVGIQTTMGRYQKVSTSLGAIHQALRPGISGTSPKYGGNEFNAGAGLFFIKSIAHVSQNYFVIYSGDALFKLRKTTDSERDTLYADPTYDRATRVESLPEWPGTTIGIDLSVTTRVSFKALLAQIGKAYHLDVKEKKRALYKKPRFV